MARVGVHFVKVDSSVLHGVCKQLGLTKETRAAFTSEPALSHHWARWFNINKVRNKEFAFERLVDTDGVSVCVHYTRPLPPPPAPPPAASSSSTSSRPSAAAAAAHAVGLPHIRRGIAEMRDFVFDPDTQIGVGIDPSVTQAVSAASGVWDPATGQLMADQLRRWKLTKGQDAVWEVYLDPKWARQRLRLYGAQDRALEQFFNKLDEEMAELSMKRHSHAKQLVVFFGAATIGTGGGWGADAVLRACCKVVCRPRGAGQRRGRVVLVDEHRTSGVSSAVIGKQPCEEELDKLSATRPADWKPPAGQVEPRLVRPAWSQERGQPVRGLVWCPVVAHRKPPQAPRISQAATHPAASEPGPSTPPPAKRSKPAAEPTKGKGKGKAAKAKPAPQPGRWLDRDCNAALNMQRIGESRWRPLELCWWPDQGALPAKGKEYPGLGYKRLRDKPHEAQQQQQQQPAEAHLVDISFPGGAGFIGSHAALRLLEQGHAVTVLDNLSRGNAGALLKLRDLAKRKRFRVCLLPCMPYGAQLPRVLACICTLLYSSWGAVPATGLMWGGGPVVDPGGGAGRAGSAVQARGCCRVCPACLHPCVMATCMQWVMVDLGDRHAVMRALAHAKPLPSLVMHFAAVAYVAESMADPVLYYKNITSTTTFLLDVMRELGIKQSCWSSSSWGQELGATTPGATAQRATSIHAQLDAIMAAVAAVVAVAAVAAAHAAGMASVPAGEVNCGAGLLHAAGVQQHMCGVWQPGGAAHNRAVPAQTHQPLWDAALCVAQQGVQLLCGVAAGEAKLMAERVINAAMKADSSLQAIILRYFNVYGSDPQGRLGEWPRPELRHHSRISGACLDAAMGLVPSVTIKGTQHPTADGSCVRDYVHVSDLVEAHLRAMQHLDNPAPVLNIGSGHPVSVKQFVAACKNVTGRDFKVVEQAEARQGDYAEVWAKIDRIQEAFDWSPRYIDVAEGLRHAWQWRLRHPQGYEKHSDDSMADGHDIS
ncbi:hypothetical protein QJQ45_027732 [Haematococcus lacustris]|nr:hypothetical protein QJQ45_027732 [Haematococcus lacustris]